MIIYITYDSFCTKRKYKCSTLVDGTSYVISYLTAATVVLVVEGPGGFFFAFFLCGRFDEFPEIQCASNK